MPASRYDPLDGRLRGRALQARRLRMWSANPHCVRCGRLTDFPHGFELDHINPVHKAGENLDDNAVQVMCHPCHEVKTNDDLNRKQIAQIDISGWPVDG